MDTVKLNPDMPEGNNCPQCGTPLPAGALAGLCPACLLALGAAADSVTEGKQPAFTPPPVTELAPLFPQLEILELIGKGGMGAVYKARQKQLDRIVALKILPPGIGDDPAFAERFTREAKALAKLNHPGIVTLYEFGSSGRESAQTESPGMGTSQSRPTSAATGKLYFFLMEFVDGVNLRQLLHSGRVSPREALAIVPQICDALQFAHDQGIVHRDIKPENILLDRRGRVKVADFGLAKIVGSDSPLTPSLSASDGERVAKPGEGMPTLTDAGKVMGTPNYMAPEQAEHPAAVDHRADIYALGVVFYQMLTGELPGKPLQPPSNKVHIDVRLDEVVLRALEKKPELRYQQASVLKTAVETISTVAPTTPFNPLPGHQPRRFQGRHAVVAGIVGLIVGLVTLAVATSLTSLLPDSFQATTRVKVDRLVPAGSNLPQPALDQDAYHLQTEGEIIRSQMVLDRVIGDLDLSGRWGQKYARGEKLSAVATLNLLKQRLMLRPLRNTRLIEISVFSEIPSEAAELANAIADSYVELRRRQVRAYLKSAESKDASELTILGEPLLWQVEIVDRATPPFRPVRPNRPLNLFIGGIISVVLGLVAAVVTGLWLYLRGGNRSPVGSSATATGGPASPVQPPQTFSLAQTPWQIWIVVALLAAEGIGNLLNTPRQPMAAMWLAAKILFITGLLLRWRPVFVLVLIVSVIHVIYFSLTVPLVGLLNQALLILVASAYRFYFPRDKEAAEPPSPANQARSVWLRVGSWIAWLLWLPVFGFGVFFLYALFSERGGWNPNPTEAVIVPLIWLGAFALPLCGLRLWRAANATTPVASASQDKGDPADSGGRWSWRSLRIADIGVAAGLIWIAVFGGMWLMSFLGGPRHEVHYRLFEVEAAVADELVPVAQRQIGATGNWQMADISPEALAALLDGRVLGKHVMIDRRLMVRTDESFSTTVITKKPGVNEDRRQVVVGWQIVSDSWGHSLANHVSNDIAKVSVHGFFGVRRKDGALQVKIERVVTHKIGDRPAVNVNIAHEGNAPQNGALAFFIPFARKDDTTGYFLLTVEVQEAGLAKLAKLEVGMERRRQSEIEQVNRELGRLTNDINGVRLNYPIAQTNAAAVASDSKRQRFDPKSGMAQRTSWTVLDQPSVFNPKGWAIMARMTVGGVVPARRPGETNDFCRIIMPEGNDDEITLKIEDISAKSVLTVKLNRDDHAEILVDGKGYRVAYLSAEVALDQPDTMPFALVIVTQSGGGGGSGQAIQGNVAKPVPPEAVTALREWGEYLTSKTAREMAEPAVANEVAARQQRLAELLRGTTAEPLWDQLKQAGTAARKAYRAGDDQEYQRWLKEQESLGERIKALILK